MSSLFRSTGSSSTQTSELTTADAILARRPLPDALIIAVVAPVYPFDADPQWFSSVAREVS